MFHITIIAKEPRPGVVKTRLCPPCTPEQAAALAAAALADTLAAVDELTGRIDGCIRRVLLFDGDPSQWSNWAYDNVAQRGDGLGDRLSNAFHDLGPGIVIGMETPHVVASLHAGLAALQRGCDTIGLAADGGYWAIGLHRIDAAIFTDVAMSTSHAGLAQLNRMHQLGRSVHHLPLARDLDTIDDAEAAAGRTPVTRLVTEARDVLATIATIDARATSPTLR